MRQLIAPVVCAGLLSSCAALQQPAPAESAASSPAGAQTAAAPARTLVVVFSDGSTRSYEGAGNVGVTAGGALTFNHRDGTEFFAPGWWREARQLP